MGEDWPLLPMRQYAYGWLCYRIVIIWPIRWFDRVPRHLLGWAGAYANDIRHYPGKSA